MTNFAKERIERLINNEQNAALISAKNSFLNESIKAKYSYNFEWLSRPIIQYPQDIVAVQELIWSVKPDLIIETGIAHGGSLILSASMLALLDLSERKQNAITKTTDRKVIGIDVDIRLHNRTEIEQHFLADYIDLIEGSSTDLQIFEEIKERSSKFKNVMVFLDSDHTHDHVFEELKLWSQLVSVGSYCVVFDTVVEDLPDEFYVDRAWNSMNNPKTAVAEFMKNNHKFIIDREIENKLVLTVAPSGFLKKICK